MEVQKLDALHLHVDEFESFGIGPKAKLLVLADNQKPITILKKLFTKGGLEKLGKILSHFQINMLKNIVEKMIVKNYQNCLKKSRLKY